MTFLLRLHKMIYTWEVCRRKWEDYVSEHTFWDDRNNERIQYRDLCHLIQKIFLMIPITFIFVFRWWRHEHDQRTSWGYHKKGWWSSNSCFDRKKSFERDLFLPFWRDTMIIIDDHFKSQGWDTEMSSNIHIMIFWWISKEWHFSWIF